MRVLITGAGGFLGQYIVEQCLARGEEVRAFGRGEYPELAAQGAEVFRGDVRDLAAVESACRGIETVYHTAAVAGIWGNWSHYFGINTQGTQHVVQACRRQGVRKLVFTSSPSVTFDGNDQCGVDESVPYASRWLCYYPQTKALAEHVVLQAHGQDGLATCALRPHLIWGPRDRHLIPRLLERARQGKLARVGDGKNLVDMVYVENAAEAHLQAADALSLDSPVGGRAYFISQGEPVNCWDWINDILALADLPPVRRSIPASVAWGIGAVMEGAYRLLGKESEPRMTRFLAAQLSTSHYFNITAAQRDFGYGPSVSTAVGMQRLKQSLQGNLVDDNRRADRGSPP
jgi:nucleoside-diphosphate-sugar epimerase